MAIIALALDLAQSLEILETVSEGRGRNDEATPFFLNEMVPFLLTTEKGSRFDLIAAAPGTANAKSLKSTYTAKVKEWNADEKNADNQIGVSFWVGVPTDAQKKGGVHTRPTLDKPKKKGGVLVDMAAWGIVA